MSDSVAQKFKDLSPEKMELLRKKLQQRHSLQKKQERIPKRKNQSVYPMSAAQKRLWFLDQLDSGSAFYNIPSALRISGELDVAAMEGAINDLVARHEILRSFYPIGAGGEPVQKVHPKLFIPLTVIDLSETPAQELDSRIKKYLSDIAATPFHLADAPLLSATLLDLPKNEFILMLNMHHIIADGWSVGIILQEILAFYAAREKNVSLPLPEPKLQFADYAQWQQDRVSTELLNDQLEYWKEYLHGMPPALEIITDFPRPSVQSHHGKQFKFTLEPTVAEKLAHLSKTRNVSLFNTLMAAVQLFFYKYTQQQDFGIGAPIANRHRREVEEIVGFFVNTIVLRARFDKDVSFLQLLDHVKNDILEATAHQDIPFERIVENVMPQRDLSRSPLFQVMFDLQKAPFKSLKTSNAELELIDIDINVAKFDLLFLVMDVEGEFQCTLEYNTELFDAETIERMARYFSYLLQQIVHKPDEKISQLSLCNEQCQRTLVQEWLKESTPYPKNATLQSLFQEQVQKTPDAVALVFNGKTTTYKQLDEQSNQLANYLIKINPSNQPLVALFLERSPDVIISILAILKSGAAYLPLDPNFPKERIAFILRDTATNLVLSTSDLAGSLPESIEHLLLLDRVRQTIGQEKTFLPDTVTGEDDLVYVMFTSGSTGEPKGVSVRHSGVVRLVKNTNYAHFGPDEKILQLAPISFDASTLEIWGALLNGGQLHIMAPGAPSFSQIADTLISQKITFLWLTAGLFHLMVDEQLDALLHVKQVLAGGDVLSLEHVRRFLHNKSAESVLINGYGPTENTTFTCCHAMWDDSTIRTSVPIGKAVSNTQVYILDSNLNPAAPGTPGELYIGGDGLARGYSNRPGLTAEKFLPNPFSKIHGDRMYRTGDLVRQRNDNIIEFLGRKDTQVKIRGFRIELGEIECQLRQHPAVRDALVSAVETSPGDKTLVAYVLANNADEKIIQDIKNFLREKIPAYMVPAFFIPLDKFPLNINGKIDRKALPQPDLDYRKSDSKFIAPRNKLEAFLAEKWKEVLGVDTISVYDNFFDLGGNSLKAAVLVNRLQEEVNLQLHVGIIFQSPRIAEFAMYAQEYFPNELRHLFGESFDVKTGSFAKGISVDLSRRVTREKLKQLRNLITPLPPRKRQPLHREKNPRAIFLLSPPRSGSTLLRIMLAGNSNLFSPPELDLLTFNTLGERYKFFKSSGLELWLEATIRALMEVKGIDSEKAEALMHSFEEQDMSVKDFYFELQRELGGRLLVDKTPSYPLDPAILQRAEEDFDEPYYIHLVRHPYAMIYSFIEAKLDQNFFKYEHPFSRQELAEMIWTTSQQNILAFLQNIPKERQIRLRFEDILRYPAEEMEKLCTFLHIDFQDEMLKPYHGKKMTDGVKDNSQMVGDFKFYLHKNIDTNVADKWRQYHQNDFLCDTAWELARGFGYPVEKKLVDKNKDIKLGNIQPAPRNADLPLSFAQQRLWFIDQLEPGNPQYNIPGGIRIKGEMNAVFLQKALHAITQKHETLRTIFMSKEGVGRAKILDEIFVPVEKIDFSDIPYESVEDKVQQYANEAAAKPFDLSRAPLFRISLLKIRELEYVLILVIHHIVSDGWSINIFLKELIENYTALFSGSEIRTQKLPIQYVDYAVWQRQQLSDERLESQVQYWKHKLEDAAPFLDLPVDYPRSAQANFRGNSVFFKYSKELFDKLNQLSINNNATLFTTTLAAFKVLLFRYTNQKDISVGTPNANRTRREIEPLIGFFVNTLVLRDVIDADDTFVGFLKSVNQTATEAMINQDLPFEKLVDIVSPNRSLNYAPLFQVMFTWQNSELESLSIPGATLEPFSMDSGTAKFDITMMLVERDGELRGQVEYDVNLFRKSSIERLLKNYETLLYSICENPHAKLAFLNVLAAPEYERVLKAFNQKFQPLDYASTIVDTFEQQARAIPEAIALIFGEQKLTFQELDARANQIANMLISKGIAREEFVGISIKRSVEMVAGMLGILKAGGAYLPLDPDYPVERLKFMLQDTGAQIVLSQTGLVDTLKSDDLEIICLDDTKALQKYAVVCPRKQIFPEQLAYIIYTSGSTGIPKGVAVSHRNVVSLIRWGKQNFDARSFRGVLFSTSINFDVSVFELFVTLAVGGTAVIAENALAIADMQNTDDISTISTVPSAISEILKLKMIPDSVQYVQLAGEFLSTDIVDQLYALPGIAKVFDIYGPSEDTVYSTWKLREPGEVATIGKPLSNTRAYILDAYMNPTPIGAPGELYLTGEGQARCYFNRPQLTAERFIPNPFETPPGSRLYRTGDQVRWLENGDIQYLGRIDNQVKIRGFRIELGEIESALSKLENITNVLVLSSTSPGGEQRLAAYIECDLASKPSIADLRYHLQKTLPEYMIPAHFVFLDAMPLTPNGKIDRKALPEPTFDREMIDNEYQAPRNDRERRLALIWQEILGLDKVGVFDNFFELGGDSILSLQVIARAKRAGLYITPRQLFEYPTIKALAAIAESGSIIHVEQGIVSGDLPATPVQAHFLQQKFKHPHHWNQAVMLEVKNSLDPKLVEQVFVKIIEHHDMLRLRVRDTEQEPQLFIAGPGQESFFEFHDLSGDVAAQHRTMTDVVDRLQRSLSLNDGPILRVAYFRRGGQKLDRLFIVIHHLAVDGISWRILAEDIQLAYSQRAAGKEIVLPPKTSSYKYWAEKLTEFAKRNDMADEQDYWKKLLDGNGRHIPVDVFDGDNIESSAGDIEADLSKDDTFTLLHEAPLVFGANVNEILIAAFASAYADWSGSESLYLQLEGHGREEIIEGADVSRTVGWFTTLYPVRLDIESADDLALQVKSVQHQIRRIPNKGIGFGILRYLHQHKENANILESVAEPEIVFNYLGQFDNIFSSTSLFRPVTDVASMERSPENHREYFVDVSCSIKNGQLGVKVGFSKNIHREKTISQLLTFYMSAIQRLIHDSRERNQNDYATVQVESAEINNEEFENLLSELNGE